jgi:hypothetical protein
MTKRLMFGLAVAAMCVVGPEAVRADTITFANVPNGDFGPGTPTVEGIFRYDAFSGGLFGELFSFGNPPPEVEGAVRTGGGGLTVVRNDVPGGLFTFDAADIVSHFREDQPVTLAGFRRMSSQSRPRCLCSALDSLGSARGAGGSASSRKPIPSHFCPFSGRFLHWLAPHALVGGPPRKPDLVTARVSGRQSGHPSSRSRALGACRRRPTPRC